MLVTIPISIFEMTIEYETPSLRLWSDRAHVVEALFEAFRPWNLDVDDIEVIETGKNSDKGLNYKLPTKKASFFFGPSYCRFKKDDANWNMVDETIEILRAGLSTLLEVAGVKIGKQKTGLSLHLQPKGGRFIDILAPFVPDQLRALEEHVPVRTMASVVKWEKRKIYIDGSGVLANAVFIRLDREFGPESSYEDIAKQIHNDEGVIFNILDVEEDLS